MVIITATSKLTHAGEIIHIEVDEWWYFSHFYHLQAISLYIHKFERKYSGIFEGSCMFYTVRFI